MLTEEEKVIVKQLKQEGYSTSEISSHLGAKRLKMQSSIDASRLATLRAKEAQETRFGDVREDVVSTLRGTGESLMQRKQDVETAMLEPGRIAREARGQGATPVQAIVEGAKALPETAFTAGGNFIGGVFDVISAPFMAGGKALLRESEEQAIKGGVQTALEATGIPQKVSEMSERGQRNVRAGLGFLDAIGLGVTGQGVRGLTSLFRGTKEVAQTTIKNTEDFFADTAKRFESRADDPNATPREREEAARSALTIKEKAIGLQPDVKARIQEMGPEKLQEYIDAVHLRNIDDTAPTPYEVGSRNVDDAFKKLQTEVQSTGSRIGQVRQKLGTYQATPDAITRIESRFVEELGDLNLTIQNGKVVQLPGTVSKTGSASDVRVLQELYDDLRVVKQSPTLTNLIDLRMAFDGKIKFGKSASEVSNSVDPVSRSVRSSIADEAAQIVGKSNAKDLEEYSNFMEAFGDLKSYVDRQAGGEYLLRLVLSGRGGDARQLIDTVKEYTGVDLMNDATAMKVATDMLGNENTKNLFRQEVTNAGYDVAGIMSGSPTALLQIGLKKLIEYGIDKEKVLQSVAAGTSGYLLMTYMGDDGVLLPAGVAILSALPNPARRQAINDAIDLLDQKRDMLINSGLKETHPSVKANEKARIDLVKKREELDFSEGEIPQTTVNAQAANIRSVKKPWAQREKELQDVAKRLKVDYGMLNKKVDEKVAKAESWKKYIDAEAEKITKTVPNTKVAIAPIKSKERILEKTIFEEEGNLDEVKDIARNTIIPFDEKARQQVLKQMDARKDLARPRKDQTPESYMGYEGTIYNIRTPDGQIVETQVVSPEMTYGKNLEEFSRSVLGDDLFEQIQKRTGLPPGLGHEFYEQARTMTIAERESGALEELHKKSVDYYNSLR